MAPSEHVSSAARIAPALAAAALALATVSAARAAAVHVAVERDRDTFVIEASAQLKADVDTAWRVLTDYGRYADFIPGVDSSRVVARSGETVTVDQFDEFAWWLFRLPVRVRYEISESPPNRLQSRATVFFLPALESSYSLTPAISGVRLEYVGRVPPGSPLRASIEGGTLQNDIVGQFSALADEIERRSASVAAN